MAKAMIDRPPVTEARLLRDLEHLGVEPSMTLTVHSSLSSIGWVLGGPGRLRRGAARRAPLTSRSNHCRRLDGDPAEVESAGCLQRQPSTRGGGQEIIPQEFVEDVLDRDMEPRGALA